VTAALVAAIARDCAAGGLDLIATCAAADYDAVVPPEVRLPDVGRPRALVIVIGNSRRLWPHVVAAAGSAAPVDDHVEAVVGGAVERALGPLAPRPRCELRFAPEPPPRRIAMQRLAHVAGLAWLAPSHLCVHPTFGPWIALRAAVVLDLEGPPPPPLSPPCECATGCGPALERALAAGTPGDTAELRERWRLWLAVRDACPVGRAHRYGEHQIRYHYTGDRTVLLPD